MNTSVKRRKKVTIRDILDEAELELMGVTESVDGSPVSSARKRSEFLEDSGMWEDPDYKKIQEKYRGKLRDDAELGKYHHEISVFIQEFFQKKVEEHVEQQSAS